MAIEHNKTHARDLLRQKKKLITERDRLVLTTGARASFTKGELPYTPEACRSLREIWSEVLALDRALLAMGVSDLDAHRVKA